MGSRMSLLVVPPATQEVIHSALFSEMGAHICRPVLWVREYIPTMTSWRVKPTHAEK
jgi:hypothetical protein